jgi:hypothetical protein
MVAVLAAPSYTPANSLGVSARWEEVSMSAYIVA